MPQLTTRRPRTRLKRSKGSNGPPGSDEAGPCADRDERQPIRARAWAPRLAGIDPDAAHNLAALAQRVAPSGGETRRACGRAHPGRTENPFQTRPARAGAGFCCHADPAGIASRGWPACGCSTGGKGVPGRRRVARRRGGSRAIGELGVSWIARREPCLRAGASNCRLRGRVAPYVRLQYCAAVLAMTRP